MTLFEQLKLFPKVDLHIDFLGSVTKDSISKLTNETMSKQELDEILEFDSLRDYETGKSTIIKLLDNLENIKLASLGLVQKLKDDNLIYAEVFVNLDLFTKDLDKKDILKTILKVFKESDIKINVVLEVASSISKDDMYVDLTLLYEYYNQGVNGIFFKKGKQENFDAYQALFDKFNKDNIQYIVLLDSRLTNQNKEIYYNASRIIYNVMDEPDDNFLNIIRENEIVLEFPITYQNYFNLYDDLANHFVYALYKENLRIAFTTYDMTSLDTDLLNEYCKLFNVFPFNLHDLVNINLGLLNRINVNDNEKNDLISEFKEKANELF